MSQMTMNPDIKSNVHKKLLHYKHQKKLSQENDQEPKMIVFGDNDPVSHQMWKSIFRDDLEFYMSDFPPIPIPTDYTPERYEEYEKELTTHVARCAAIKKYIYGLYNLAAPKQDPRLHLVLVNRRLKRSELGRWAQTDNSESSESDGVHQDPRFISIKSLRCLIWRLLNFNLFSSVFTVESARLSLSTMYSEKIMDFIIESNVYLKVQHYLECLKDDEQELKMIVYGDEDDLSRNMWKSLFRDDLRYDYEYEGDFPPIPIPARYTPQCYRQYKEELRKYLQGWRNRYSYNYRTFNLAASEKDLPRIHLLFANRMLKPSELGRWAKSFEPALPESSEAHQNPRFISILKLRNLILKFVNVDPIPWLLTVESSTSSSLTSIDKTSRQFPQALDQSRITAPGAVRPAGHSTSSSSSSLSSIRKVSSATSSSSSSGVESSATWRPWDNCGERGLQFTESLDPSRTSASCSEYPEGSSTSSSTSGVENSATWRPWDDCGERGHQVTQSRDPSRPSTSRAVLPAGRTTEPPPTDKDKP